MKEIEKDFFPKDFEKRITKKPENAVELGTALADESLKSIKVALVRT